jgi:hypothetical protein
LDSVENLDCHPAESLVFLLLIVVVDLDVSLLSWVDSSFKESLEALLESFFPKEGLALVLAEELAGSTLNVLEVVGKDLHGAEQLELVLDLNQVVSAVRVQSGHLDGQRDEVVDDLL